MAAQAGEPVDGPSGFLCGFSSEENPTAEPGTQTGEIDGGPLAIVDAEGNIGSGTLTCTIQVNQNTHAGSGVSVSGSGTGVIVIPPSIVSYQAGADDLVYLCTEFRYDNGTTLYFHSSDDPTVEGHWSLDVSSTCGLSTSIDVQGAARELVCVAVSGCNNVNTIVCVSVDGCNGGSNLICAAAFGCSPSASPRRADALPAPDGAARAVASVAGLRTG